MRNAGLSYINCQKKVVQGRAVKAKDCTTCRRKCSTHINEEQRADIFNHFWGMEDKNRQRDFVIHHVQKEEKKRQSKPGSRRQNTLTYSLIINDAKVKVCKDFFLKTLDVSEKFTRSALASSTAGTCQSVRVRKEEPKNKISSAAINTVREHIKSFHTIESHYSRKDTAKAYLEGTLNVKKMYELYKEKCAECHTKPGPVKESMYRKTFTSEFNIAFHIPKKDACKMCENFRNLPDHEKVLHAADYQAHQARKEQARNHKKQDKELGQSTESVRTCTFNLEQVLTTPWSNVSSLYYSRKLST